MLGRSEDDLIFLNILSNAVSQRIPGEAALDRIDAEKELSSNFKDNFGCF